ncbi:hypothetical protein BLNAU_10118 [Blattamonas nauphoetae]|uniref:Hyaluronan/mRNA-binding protein domain-containing protein n=1 Tax=Blattamonas nauphoetae TaxID=2049346 RepID=A0ABQ9XU31_9EUKA|nr:hypothetical protein BLNAU_10118 [Blattamonas nauphoetae]
MSFKGGNLFNELDIEDEAHTSAKKKQKQEKTKLALKDQKPSSQAQTTSAQSSNHKKHAYVPVVDTSRPEKRVYDRKSGTGRGKEVSKSGHLGAGKEIEEETVKEAISEVVDGVAPAPEETPKPTEEKVEEVKEEKVAPIKTKTLQEYEEELNAQKIQLEMRKPRKAGEGDDTLKGFKLIDQPKPAQKTVEPTKQETKKAAAVDNSIFFEKMAEANRGNRYRGGDRGDRGDRGRKYENRDRHNQGAPKTAAPLHQGEAAFPSL